MNSPDTLIPRAAGTLTTVTGPMFAGKTKALIEVARAFADSPDRVLVVVPNIDTRHGLGVIRSHDGLSLEPSVSVRILPVHTHHGLPLARLQAGETTVLIDEAQFFGPHVLDWATHLTRLLVRVYAFGLELDYKGDGFGLMPELIQRATHRVRLKGVCARCSAPATRTHRTAREAGQVLIGGADAYEPRCLPCWETGRGEALSAQPAA